jgi:hypothetical protein
MLDAVVSVRASADDGAICIDNDGSHAWVG